MRVELQHQQMSQPDLDLVDIATRLDRVDVLLLRRFYITGRPGIDSTQPHVLRVLVNTIRRTGCPVEKRLSYSAIRRRLENLACMGVLETVPHSNPKAYLPVEHLAIDIRKAILSFAAELVGLRRDGDGE